MSEPIQTIFAVLGTIFDMFTTMLFYKRVLAEKTLGQKKLHFILSIRFFMHLDLH